MTKPRIVLFVCLGNICRSPMAEELFRQRIAKHGLADRFRVRSAGIIAGKDHVPPLEAIRTAAEHDVDIRGHLSRPLTADLLDQSDLVVAMDRSNVEHILNLLPDLGPRLRLLKQYADDADDYDVPDPMGCPIEVFRESYRQIASGIDGLIAAIEEEEKKEKRETAQEAPE
jgi:protein-tyrosine-phosphatase